MQKCFFPEEKCIELISSLWKFKIDKPHFKSESPEHDIRLTELRLRLERLPQFRGFFPENLLQSSSDLAEDTILGDFVKIQSDGALVLKGSESSQLVYSVEMEISLKNAFRYTQKLASYYLSENIDGILYVCSKPAIIQSLKEADIEVRKNRDSILHFVIEKDVFQSSNKIIFTNAKEGFLDLG